MIKYIRLCRDMTQVNITRIATLACANMVFNFCLICILLNETKKLSDLYMDDMISIEDMKAKNGALQKTNKL